MFFTVSETPPSIFDLQSRLSIETARSSKDALSAGTANTIAVANGADAFTPDLSDIGSAVSRDLVQKDVADTSNTVNVSLDSQIYATTTTLT